MDRRSRVARTTVETGREAESRIALLYESHGFEVVGRNVRVGRLELDLILRRGALIVVCEVKHRASSEFGHPAAFVDRLKRERVRRAAARWLDGKGYVASVRFDVATIVGEPSSGRIELFSNAF